MFGLPVGIGTKLVAAGAAVAVLALGFWAWGEVKWTRGYHLGKSEVQEKVNEYVNDLSELRAKSKYDQLMLAVENAKTVDELQQALKSAKDEKAKVQVLIKEVPKYVTAKADQKCVVPAGAVWLLDRAIRPELAASAAVVDREPGDADAPSGVALSQVTGITADNLAECVERGTVISSWQRWYEENKVRWEAHRAKWEAEKGPETPR